ncbi:MAG: trypsin-like peptidase domain-containing protein [Gemmataceae bacterium]
MSAALVTCPECRSPLRLPKATPEGRVRCPKCKAVFTPIIEAEEDFSDSVAVPLDESADPDRSFFDRVAHADDPFEPPKREPFEVIPDAEPVESPPVAAPPKRVRRSAPEPEVEPRSAGNGWLIALVAAIGFLLLGGVAGASFLAYRLLKADAARETVSPVIHEGPADTRIPADAISKVRAATVHVRTAFPDGQAASSAGFFVPGPGLILTNARSVGQGPKKTPATKISVNHGPRFFAARILAADSELDLALLQVAGLDLPEPLPLTADTFTVRESMPLVVFTASESKVQHVNATVSGSRAVGGTRPWWLLNGPLPAGTWGGPVTDDAGRVVGVAAVAPEGESAAEPAESAWSFVQRGAKSAESSGGIAFASPDAGRKSRDDWDDGGAPNPWRPGMGRQPNFPPGWDQQFPLPPGIDPNLFPRPPRDRRER